MSNLESPVFPSFNKSSGIIADSFFNLPKNEFIDELEIKDNEDCSNAFKLSRFRVCQDVLFKHRLVTIFNEIVIEPIIISCSLDAEMVDALRERIANLPKDWFELWPSNHNVSHGFHFAEPWGEATEVLARLENALPISRPEYNHNKISSRKKDKFLCNEMHLDSFEGMRYEFNGERKRISRYFLNLGENSRDTMIAINSPKFVTKSIGADYKPNYLDPLLAAANYNVPCLLLDTPARNKETGEIYGYKILTTHLLHGEFGPKHDLLAIVNSLG